MVLEVRVGVAVAVGEGDPQLRAVQEAGVRLGTLLGVADGPSGRHEAQFARADRLQAARGVAVQHLALVEPADGLESHVRVRRDLHTGLVGDVVGPVVIDGTPRADHAAAQVGQQAADFGGLAELDPTDEEFTHRLGHHETAATAQRGNCLAIKIAHGPQPRPVGDRPSGRPPSPGLPWAPPDPSGLPRTGYLGRSSVWSEDHGRRSVGRWSGRSAQNSSHGYSSHVWFFS